MEWDAPVSLNACGIAYDAPEPALKDRVRSIAAQLSIGAVEGSLNAYGIAYDATGVAHDGQALRQAQGKRQACPYRRDCRKHEVRHLDGHQVRHYGINSAGGS